MALDDLEQTVVAAHDARVRTLFAAFDAYRWGAFDPASRRVELHDRQAVNGDELLDLAAADTCLHGGTVYAVDRDEAPRQQSLAATVRLPMPRA
jgi:hypothetical protein